MKISQKILSTAVILFAATTISFGILHFLNYFNGSIDIMMIFLGLTSVTGGLSQINLAKQLDSKGNSKGNIIVGIFSIIIGIILLISFIMKMILSNSNN